MSVLKAALRDARVSAQTIRGVGTIYLGYYRKTKAKKRHRPVSDKRHFAGVAGAQGRARWKLARALMHALYGCLSPGNVYYERLIHQICDVLKKEGY